MKIGIVLLIIICVAMVIMYKVLPSKKADNVIHKNGNKTTIEDEKQFITLVSSLAKIYRAINE